MSESTRKLKKIFEAEAPELVKPMTGEESSVRAKQPAPKPAAKKPTGTAVNKGKRCPMWIRSGDCGRLGYTPR